MLEGDGVVRMWRGARSMRAYGQYYSFDDGVSGYHDVAIVSVCGAVWVDWDRLIHMIGFLAARLPRGDTVEASVLFQLRCLLHARGHLKEVSLDEVDRLALMWGDVFSREAAADQTVN